MFLTTAAPGLPKDISGRLHRTGDLDKTDLEAPVGHLPTSLMSKVDRGLHGILRLKLQRSHSGMTACWCSAAMDVYASESARSSVEAEIQGLRLVEAHLPSTRIRVICL